MKLFGRAGSTFATVIAAVVVLAIASTSGAVAGGLITSKQIKNNTIKSKDVKNGTLKPKDLSSDTQRRFTSINGYAVVTVDSSSAVDGSGALARAVCPTGTMVVGGGASWANGSAGDSFLSRSGPESSSTGGRRIPRPPRRTHGSDRA